jgi:hypothetical protein
MDVNICRISTIVLYLLTSVLDKRRAILGKKRDGRHRVQFLGKRAGPLVPIKHIRLFPKTGLAKNGF